MATILKMLRAAAFYLLLTLWLLIFPTVLTPWRWLKPERSKTIALLWLKGAVWLATYICGIHYVIRGREHIPNQPAIFACQHQSAWETFLFPTILNLPMMVVKKELLNIPIFGAYLRYIGMAAIDRKAGVSALKQISDMANAALAGGRNVLVFPEGTRVTIGTRGRIQAGIAALYEQCDAPVIPVTHNAGRFWPKNSFLKTPGVVRLRFHPPVPRGLSKAALFEHLSRVYYGNLPT
jgi:1-acyl-sn-glycerol-3-phosphate acyltransferase